MNILRISNRLFPDSGGMAKQAFILSKFYSQKGINSFNLTCIPQGKSFIREKSINKHFKIIYLPINTPGFNASYIKLFLFTLKFLIFGTIKALQIIKNKYNTCSFSASFGIFSVYCKQNTKNSLFIYNT